MVTILKFNVSALQCFHGLEGNVEITKSAVVTMIINRLECYSCIHRM